MRDLFNTGNLSAMFQKHSSGFIDDFNLVRSSPAALKTAFWTTGVLGFMSANEGRDPVTGTIPWIPVGMIAGLAVSRFNSRGVTSNLQGGTLAAAKEMARTSSAEAAYRGIANPNKIVSSMARERYRQVTSQMKVTAPKAKDRQTYEQMQQSFKSKFEGLSANKDFDKVRRITGSLDVDTQVALGAKGAEQKAAFYSAYSRLSSPVSLEGGRTFSAEALVKDDAYRGKVLEELQRLAKGGDADALQFWRDYMNKLYSVGGKSAAAPAGSMSVAEVFLKSFEQPTITRHDPARYDKSTTLKMLGEKNIGLKDQLERFAGLKIKGLSITEDGVLEGVRVYRGHQHFDVLFDSGSNFVRRGPGGLDIWSVSEILPPVGEIIKGNATGQNPAEYLASELRKLQGKEIDAMTFSRIKETIQSAYNYAHPYIPGDSLATTRHELLGNQKVIAREINQQGTGLLEVGHQVGALTEDERLMFASILEKEGLALSKNPKRGSYSLLDTNNISTSALENVALTGTGKPFLDVQAQTKQFFFDNVPGKYKGTQLASNQAKGKINTMKATLGGIAGEELMLAEIMVGRGDAKNLAIRNWFKQHGGIELTKADIEAFRRLATIGEGEVLLDFGYGTVTGGRTTQFKLPVDINEAALATLEEKVGRRLKPGEIIGVDEARNIVDLPSNADIMTLRGIDKRAGAAAVDIEYALGNNLVKLISREGAVKGAAKVGEEGGLQRVIRMLNAFRSGAGTKEGAAALAAIGVDVSGFAMGQLDASGVTGLLPLKGFKKAGPFGGVQAAYHRSLGTSHVEAVESIITNAGMRIENGVVHANKATAAAVAEAIPKLATTLGVSQAELLTGARTVDLYAQEVYTSSLKPGVKPKSELIDQLFKTGDHDLARELYRNVVYMEGDPRKAIEIRAATQSMKSDKKVEGVKAYKLDSNKNIQDQIIALQKEHRGGAFLIDLGTAVEISGGGDSRYVAIPANKNIIVPMVHIDPKSQTERATPASRKLGHIIAGYKKGKIERELLDDYTRELVTGISGFLRGDLPARMSNSMYGKVSKQAALNSRWAIITPETARQTLDLTESELDKVARLTNDILGRTDISAEQKSRFLARRLKKLGKESKGIRGLLTAVGTRWPVTGPASVAKMHIAISSNKGYSDNILHVHSDLKAALGMDFDGDAIQLVKLNTAPKKFNQMMSNYDKKVSFFKQHFFGTTADTGFSKFSSVVDSLLKEVAEPGSMNAIQDILEKSVDTIGSLTKYSSTLQAMTQHLNAQDYVARHLAGDKSVYTEMNYLEAATTAIRQKGIDALKHESIGRTLVPELYDALHTGGEKGFRKFAETLVDIEWIDQIKGKALDYKQGREEALELTMDVLRKPFQNVFGMENPMELFDRFKTVFSKIQNFADLDSEAAQKLVEHILTGSLSGHSADNLTRAAAKVGEAVGALQGTGQSIDMLTAINEGINAISKSKKGGFGKWVGVGVAAIGLMGLFTPEGVMDELPESNHPYAQYSAFDQTAGPSGPWSSPYDSSKDPAKSVSSPTKITSKSIPAPTGPQAFPEASKHHRSQAMSPERAQPVQPNTAPSTDNTAASTKMPIDSVTKEPSILAEREIVATQVDKFPKLQTKKVIDTEEDMRQVQKNFFSLLQGVLSSQPMVNFSELHTVNHMANDDRIIQDLIHSDLTEDNP